MLLQTKKVLGYELRRRAHEVLLIFNSVKFLIYTIYSS